MCDTTVIIPAFNCETVLERAVKSALEQTVPPAQVIVVDDGSSDGTADAACRFRADVLFIQQQNQGQGAARNRGLEEATGKYVAFLDADDYWRPQFIEKMEAFLEAHEDAVAASCGFLVKRTPTDYIGPSNLEELHSNHPDGLVLENFFAFWAEYDHVRTGTVLIRKSVIDAAGRQNAALRVSQDLEYWALIATYGPWGQLPEILWVGDSHAHACASGWRQRYRKRRRLCPGVEDWQARIRPRLPSEYLAHFRVVRGRVAAGFALNHILGGDTATAIEIVRDYGPEMPPNTIVKLMKHGARLGSLPWILVVGLIRAREFVK